MNSQPNHRTATDFAPSKGADFAVSGYWRTYYFGYFFITEGAPGE